MRKDFACIVISHGRPDCSTVKVLQSSGYTGKIYIVADDEDEAKRLGYKFHLQLDDDVHGFGYHFVQDGKLRSVKCNHLDEVFSGMVELMKETPITSLSFGLSSYYLGGAENKNFDKGMIQKTMTTFLMRADDVQYFNMRMNDDITTSLINGMRGKLYYTYMSVMVYVDATQVQHGGMTEIYQKNGENRSTVSCAVRHVSRSPQWGSPNIVSTMKLSGIMPFLSFCHQDGVNIFANDGWRLQKTPHKEGEQSR
ncbi:beta-glucosyl-HMC-alpha-glucosyltransferase [Lactobacillus phage Ld17]|uniref:TET-Associated Glycosyltransferase domain-containing protein n=1 Tax=Lactobacillus phage Ld17 TaxID=1500733 RepID=A0A075KJU1_9CAUD|nr:beta-glucosyl-HMC-alpha-glucosyltransferase [Lactobacillus phage Ld17]AIF54376.1 hypothetical protein LDB17_001 [Lactobacillus phage Ld17]